MLLTMAAAVPQLMDWKPPPRFAERRIGSRRRSGACKRRTIFSTPVHDPRQARGCPMLSCTSSTRPPATETIMAHPAEHSPHSVAICREAVEARNVSCQGRDSPTNAVPEASVPTPVSLRNSLRVTKSFQAPMLKALPTYAEVAMERRSIPTMKRKPTPYTSITRRVSSPRVYMKRAGTTNTATTPYRMCIKPPSS